MLKPVHGFNNLLNVNAVSKRTRESPACGIQSCDEHALCWTHNNGPGDRRQMAFSLGKSGG